MGLSVITIVMTGEMIDVLMVMTTTVILIASTTPSSMFKVAALVLTTTGMKVPVLVIGMPISLPTFGLEGRRR